MGCFSETCAVSNTAIHYGDEVAVLFFTENTYQSSGVRCYANNYVNIAPLFFYGKYNDYGTVEEIDETQIGYRMLLNLLKTRQLTRETWEKFTEEERETYRMDRPADPKDFDGGEFFSFMQDGEVVTNSGDVVEFLMVHRTVLETILREFRHESYVGDIGLPDGQIYVGYGWNKVLSDADEYVQKVLDFKMESEMMDPLDRSLMQMRSMNGLPLYQKGDRTNYVAHYIRSGTDSSSHSALVSPTDLLMECAGTIPKEELKELVLNLATVAYLDTYMYYIHKAWIKPISSGQEAVWHGHDVLAKAIADVKAKDQEKRGDEDEDLEEGKTHSDSVLNVDEIETPEVKRW